MSPSLFESKIMGMSEEKNGTNPEMERIMDRLYELGGDIIRSERFQRAKSVPHHGTTSVAKHSLAVAGHALQLCERAEKIGKKVNTTDAVRAALLHDIGMTDEDVFKRVSFVKAYEHPIRSAEIAKNEFHANDVQVRAIERHMWPVCITPPDSREGWIVLAADKHCALAEVTGNTNPGGILDGELRHEKAPGGGEDSRDE